MSQIWISTSFSPQYYIQLSFAFHVYKATSITNADQCLLYTTMVSSNVNQDNEKVLHEILATFKWNNVMQ